MANPPAAPGYGKRSSSKARKQPAAKPGSGKRITGKQPATKPGSDPRPPGDSSGNAQPPNRPRQGPS